jgi:hypothetical protein
VSIPKIFISYSRKDKQFVERLTKDLNNQGVDVWIDVQQISPGAMWQDEIRKGIESSGIFVIVLSSNYTSSSWASFELAIATGKRILPLKIEEPISEKIPNIITSLQWIDFTEDYNAGIGQLINSIPKDFKSNRPIKVKEEKSKGYVFLSFCEEDTNFIVTLRDFLKSQEFAYWDFEEGDRNYHTQFFLELENVINDSEAVLSVISPDWKKSRWSIREFFYSEEIGKPVLLLRAKMTKPILAIAGLPYIDFVTSKEKGFEKLGKELKKRLN